MPYGDTADSQGIYCRQLITENAGEEKASEEKEGI